MFPGIVVFGLGLSLTVAPLTATALGAVDDEHAGVASGVNNAVARTGQLLAVAAIPVVAGFAPGESVATDELARRLRHRHARRGRRSPSSPPSSPCSRSAAPLGAAVEPSPWHCAAGGPPPVAEPAAPQSRAERRRNPAARDDGRIVAVPSVAAGDHGAALLALYDDAVGEVYGYLLARCRNRTIAEDVTSDVFMGAVDAVSRGRVDDRHDGLADRHRPPQARRPLAARRARAAPPHRRRRRARRGRRRGRPVGRPARRARRPRRARAARRPPPRRP